MFKRPDGVFVLELNDRLSKITMDTRDGKGFITESQFGEALKDFNFKESLETLGLVSGKIYLGNVDNKQWERLGKGLVRNKRIRLLVHQNAIEYIANLFIMNESNTISSDSLKSKDNLLGLFNIHNNSLVIGSIESRNILSIMVSMWQEQLRSQSNDLQSFGRAVYLFEQNNAVKIFKEKTLEDILVEKTGLTVAEYFNVGLILFAFAINHPKITIADLKSENPKFKKIINNELIEKFLTVYAGTIDELRVIDKLQNKNLNPKNTKNRFNPLWIKPMIKFSQNEYIVPSVATYIQSLFTGLYWLFDEIFMNERCGADVPKTTFRNVFGKEIFEPYVGTVLRDIYGDEAVTPEIIYGKTSKAFTDWVVIDGDDAYLIEVKAYQFPFKTLQTGDLELIAKEITKKLIQDTVLKIKNKIKDIESIPRLSFLKGKNIVPVVVTYNVPLIDTSMYRKNIGNIVDQNSLKSFEEFKGYFINIADLECYGCVSKVINLKDVLVLVQTNNSNFIAETMKIYKENNLTEKTISEKRYDQKIEYIKEMIKP